MLESFFTKLFGKKSSKEEVIPEVQTREVNETCNYWADEQEVDYSSMHTAQDVLADTTDTSETDSEDSSEKDEEKKKTSVSFGGCGCGGGCFGGCGGGCF